MADTTITNEIKRHTVIVSIKAKQGNLEITGFLQVDTFFFCEIRKDLLNEKWGLIDRHEQEKRALSTLC
ncbi:unnamed protein product [Hymenolepis diminuta]|uniref:Uncharacterized protein n=1 Tax=Hymenolepis diminuta TaxID=6216 RepID=A0A564YK69_HYMDI|nr:unnamed protein product [Hymenolepis diminuta]